MNTAPIKLNDEKLETKLDARQFVTVVYERVMVKSWIMSGSTEQVHWTMYGHVLQVAVQIVGVSHLAK